MHRYTRQIVSWIGAVAAVACTAGAPLVAQPVLRGDLPRGADLGFQAGGEEGRLVVRAVEPDSAAAAAGLAPGDRIVAVAGQRIDSPHVGQDLLRRLDGDRPAVLSVRRGDADLTVRFTPPPKPLEAIEGLEIEYGDLTTPDGSRLRTLVSRPAGIRAPLPALFFVQWVSCDSVELGGSSTAQVMRRVAHRSGMVLLRVERSAGGDSEGPGCHELDYETELAHYRHAFGVLARHPWVDADRIVVWGGSLGSTMAPLVARGRDVAGVMMSGAGAKTYLERMIDFDRIGFERGDLDPREIHERMLRHTRFHVHYLLEGKDPDAIVAEHPELAAVWEAMRGTGDGVHYGRPYAYHRQAAQTDFLEAWLDVQAPILVLYGELDQFEPRHGHELVARMVNRQRPGAATFVELPSMGHSYRVFPTAEDAARWELGQPAPELVVRPILSWLRDVVGIDGVRLAP